MSADASPDELASWVDRTLELARGTEKLEWCEVRADRRRERRVAYRNHQPMGSRESAAYGIGIQVRAGGGTAYVHVNDWTPARVQELLEQGVDLAAAQARRSAATATPAPDHAARVDRRVDLDGHPMDVEENAILDVLARSATGLGPGLDQHQCAFGARAVDTIVGSTSGSWCRLESLVSTLFVSATARGTGRVGNGTARAAGERGMRDYEREGGPEAVGALAGARARESLEAVTIPSGRYRVLCDNELSGTLAHESFGHLTEHDLVASGWSTLRGRRGQTLAPDFVSVVDAPVVEGAREQGVHVPYDEQGTRGRTVRMLDRGVLRAWMHTRESAAEVGDAPGGNGRALDSRFPPIVRMRNTYFEPGDHSKAEALEALGDGIYLVGARGGAPHSDGSFMFTAICGYRVESGELREPVRMASIHGNVLDFLQNVELLTRDFEVTTNYFGGCGKREQSYLHVGVGGPHLLVRDALIGGV